MDTRCHGRIVSALLCRSLGLVLLAALMIAGAGCGPRYTAEQLDATRKWQALNLPRAPFPLSRELKILIWSNYLPLDVIRRFEAVYGVKVKVEYFSENEELHDRLVQPGANYDMVMPGAYMVQQLIRERQLKPVQRERIPNLRHVDAGFFHLKHDPGLKYSVPFFEATVGIVFNIKYSSGLPLTWPEFAWESAQKMARGRIAAVDEMRTTIGTALLMQGFSPNTRKPEEISRAQDLLVQTRSELGLRFELDDMPDLLTKEEMILGTAWTGDAANALGRNAAVRFLVPRGLSITELDSFCVPVTAPNPETAEFFINFLLTPEISGALTNFSSYANTCSASRAFVSPLILNGPAYMEPLPNSAIFLEDVEDAGPLYRAAWKVIKESRVPEISKVPLPFPRTEAGPLR